MKKQNFLIALLTVFVVFSSCKKLEGPKGDQGVQGVQGVQGEPGPNAKKYEFSLTFGTSVTSQSYNVPTGPLYGKVAFVYLDVGYKDWILLPYYENTPGYVPVNYISICDEVNGKIEVKTLRGDNEAGSPWAVNNVVKYFRVVIIETSGLKPNVDHSNYSNVIESYNL